MPPAKRTSGSQKCSAATRLPFTTPSTAIRICTPWQMVKIGLSASWKCFTSRCTRGSIRMYSGPRPPAQ